MEYTVASLLLWTLPRTSSPTLSLRCTRRQPKPMWSDCLKWTNRSISKPPAFTVEITLNFPRPLWDGWLIVRIAGNARNFER